MLDIVQTVMCHTFVTDLSCPFCNLKVLTHSNTHKCGKSTTADSLCARIPLCGNAAVSQWTVLQHYIKPGWCSEGVRV